MEKKDVALVLATILLIALVVAGIASQPKQKTKDALINDIFANVDQGEVDRLKDVMRSTEAKQRGDTYCNKCDKVNPGKVRICTYCGQYIE